MLKSHTNILQHIHSFSHFNYKTMQIKTFIHICTNWELFVSAVFLCSCATCNTQQTNTNLQQWLINRFVLHSFWCVAGMFKCVSRKCILVTSYVCCVCSDNLQTPKDWIEIYFFLPVPNETQIPYIILNFNWLNTKASNLKKNLIKRISSVNVIK